jgi:hypothetical protein
MGVYRLRNSISLLIILEHHLPTFFIKVSAGLDGCICCCWVVPRLNLFCVGAGFGSAAKARMPAEPIRLDS